MIGLAKKRLPSEGARRVLALSFDPITRGVTTMQSTNHSFAVPVRVPVSIPVHDLRYRIADLLARIEAENDGLDPASATLALLETAFGATLTLCRSPDRARQHLDAAVERIHTDHLTQSGPTQTGPAGFPQTRTRERASASLRQVARPSVSAGGSQASQRVFLAVTVAVLSWATVVFLAHRGPLSPWNLLGPLFCTLLALVSAYRFLVSSGYMRPWSLFSREPRLRLQ